MEKVEEEETAQKMRIYMGGLGINVTQDEIRKTFSGLGRVDSVDVYRTKGRSFAYLDFVPSSEKSLPKLFSTYNGCMWKGGRLKLEKAKEHYLLRLKREWEDDVKLTKTAPISGDIPDSKPSLEKPKKFQALEKPNVRIFFPKLSKMKSLPFGGTGKHKYSFQRIEVPPLPIHFCDCEEHCDSFHQEKGTPFDLETANGGIREEELSIMESVMKKLFEKETHSTAVPDRDEDNLIINIVAGGKGSMPLLGNQAQKTTRGNKELIHGRSKTFKDPPDNSLNTSQRNNVESFNKKRKLPLRESREGNEHEFFEAKRKKSSQVTPKGQEDQSTEPKSHPQKSKNNISWSQKSAWKDLIGKKADSSFQFSSVLPSVPSTKEDQPDSSSIMPSNSSAMVDLPQSLHSVPSIASAKVKQPQSSHSIAKISSTTEEQSRSGDLIVITNSTSEEKQNTLQHGNPESETTQSKDQQDGEAPAFASPNDVSVKTARGAAWRQKSSWTQLVADANKNSFSISQVLPGLSFKTQEPSQPNATNVAANTSNGEDQNLCKLDKQENSGHGLEVKNRPLHAAPGNSDAKSTVESEQTKGSTIVGNREASFLKLENRRPLIRKPISVADFGETCSFKRSADSLKEWAKAKASLSNSLKKKREPEEK
ncbi:RRM domain-containing protein [Heracleum sosnowskyi]|uniref:RRM domain-containing protein n=1 Tax=Heracleum sosnowskyi TaxID=360622 RepID=A0AAD8HFP7_9APIA|nr:RRM domain-containing protein [Heracleum sosnowskyi]